MTRDMPIEVSRRSPPGTKGTQERCLAIDQALCERGVTRPVRNAMISSVICDRLGWKEGGKKEDQRTSMPFGRTYIANSARRREFSTKRERQVRNPPTQ